MPTFEDLLSAMLCATFGGNVADAESANGQLTAYLAANGPQTVTVAATGKVFTVKAYSAHPWWIITGN